MDTGTGYNWRQRAKPEGKLQERQEGSEGVGRVQRSGDQSPIGGCNISSVGHLRAWGSEVQVRLTPVHLREQGDRSG